MPGVMAHFVCGEVIDSEDNMSAQWFEVKLFAGLNYTNCQISPAGNKYCCDSEAVFGSWKIGKTINAEVFDNSAGYVAGPVSGLITGEGYDIMPLMQLEKVINIDKPAGKIVFSNVSKFLLNASFRAPYNFIELEKNSEKVVLCSNCSNISRVTEGNFGMNYLKLFASYGQKVFLENIVFAILSKLDFDRKISCEKCRKNIVKSGQEVDVTLFVNLSNEVFGFELKEYVPVDFEILQTDGKVEKYSSSHNLILWNVSGKNIVKSYKIMPLGIRFFPKKYILKAELENQGLKEETIVVSRIFPFFAFNQIADFSNIKRKVYSRISPTSPMVIRPNEENIVRLAIFPNKTVTNAEFTLKKAINEEQINGTEIVNYYFFDTNLAQEDIDRIYIEFRVNKTAAADYGEMLFFVLNEDWNTFEAEKYNEDPEYFYYKSFVRGKAVAIGGEGKGFFEALYG